MWYNEYNERRYRCITACINERIIIMKNLKIDNHKNYNLICVLDYKEIHLIQVDNIYIDRYCGSMSVIGERLWVWSTKVLCNLVRGVGECTRQPLHDVKYL